ncbi:hypothetical protein [Spiroplasma turonicum]|uniref:Uncharacterized protein n=1 Tax=Spiroplasma turonicum TaxID=216946 RepID=A0A0K1P6X3_9MOLU|nr:hypothetical protein [Spiroplasma turonicum]AKU79632.1 hypothetical protein STURON_00386 [Spiroplasma turonicum]ALX70653.1 hypothetical protein STURO_v1c03850 [Spiroplasma turonicum]
MAVKFEYDKLINVILKKIIEYNKINSDIKRYNIFNSFSISYEIEDTSLYFEIHNTDDTDDISLTSLSSEQSIRIDLQKLNEVNWLMKTINRFIDKSKESLNKARELAKPHVGILIYDEFTDTYYLNPSSGPILLRTKEIEKEIAATRFDIFSIFINLRSALVGNDNLAEIIGASPTKVLERIRLSVEFIKSCESKLLKIEGIPRYIVNFNEFNKIITYSTFATNDFGPNIITPKRINEKVITASIDKLRELDKVYAQVRKDEEVSKIMLDLARSLVSKNNPKLYSLEDSTKFWVLSREGRTTMKNLNIIDFLDNDMSEIEFYLN